MEIEKLIPEDRMVGHLRSLGFELEERRVEKWSGNECWHTWEWQIRNASGKWIKAWDIFRDIVIDHTTEALVGSVTKMDMIQKLK